MLGMIASCFGLVIFTSGLSSLLRFKLLETVSEGMLVLLWVSFIGAFVFGVIYSIVHLSRGRGKVTVRQQRLRKCFGLTGRGVEACKYLQGAVCSADTREYQAVAQGSLAISHAFGVNCKKTAAYKPQVFSHCRRRSRCLHPRKCDSVAAMVGDWQ